MFSLPFGTPSAREKQFSQYAWSRCSEIYATDANINGHLNLISRFFNNFPKTFISLMKHRKCKVCLPFWAILSLTGCRSNCFTFLTGGYAFIRLVGVRKASSCSNKIYYFNVEDSFIHFKNGSRGIGSFTPEISKIPAVYNFHAQRNNSTDYPTHQ